MSIREQDLQDIGAIIKYKNFHSPFDTFKYLKDMEFDTIDLSVLLEGFSYAYGMDWLENFLKKIKINFANFINSIKQDDCQLASRLVFYDEMK
ncbi:hypothetical protein AMCSP13_000556 [Streptococcus pneumoniae 2070335]|nr:hypothetical protein AMCSP13_000556 [Streptococcus pneumoniae 2070335]